MVQKSRRPSDIMALVGAIDPDVTAAGSVSTGWVDAADFEMFTAMVMAGALGSSATVDAKIEQATDSSGTGAKDVAGKAITQLTEAGSDDDKQAFIEVCGEDLDVDNDFNHIRLTVTVAVATSDVGGALFGINARYGPASDQDAASVAEYVGLDA